MIERWLVVLAALGLAEAFYLWWATRRILPESPGAPEIMDWETRRRK